MGLYLRLGTGLSEICVVNPTRPETIRGSKVWRTNEIRFNHYSARSLDYGEYAFAQDLCHLHEIRNAIQVADRLGGRENRRRFTTN
jgi:hypothetical protein